VWRGERRFLEQKSISQHLKVFRDLIENLIACYPIPFIIFRCLWKKDTDRRVQGNHEATPSNPTEPERGWAKLLIPKHLITSLHFFPTSTITANSNDKSERFQFHSKGIGLRNRRSQFYSKLHTQAKILIVRHSIWSNVQSFPLWHLHERLRSCQMPPDLM